MTIPAGYSKVRLTEFDAIVNVSGDVVGMVDADGTEMWFARASVDAAANITGILAADGQAHSYGRILAQSAIPFVLPSSGTFTGGTGALSAITALPATYSGGCFMYFPAGAGLPQGAGWYWTIMSSTTAGTVYNNVYSSGDPKVASPGSGVAGTAITSGAASYTQTTSTVYGPSHTLPGGALGKNGMLYLDHSWQTVNNANAKLGYCEVGAISSSTSLASVASRSVLRRFFNENSEAVNKLMNGWSTLDGTYSRGTVNTAADVTIRFGMDIDVATDYIVLEMFETTVRYGA